MEPTPVDPESKDNKEYRIRELDDGTYLVCIGGYGPDSEEYSYQNLDDMLTDIRNDLEGDEKDEGSSDGKDESSDGPIKKIMKAGDDTNDE